MRELFHWFDHHETLAWGLVAFSAACFVITLIAVPWSLTRLPADFFAAGKPRAAPGDTALKKTLWRIGKNALGWFFIAIGVLLLVLPGQGLLTLVAGLLLIDFPRKRRVLRWLVARGPVLRYINRRRQRAGRAPLKM